MPSTSTCTLSGSMRCPSLATAPSTVTRPRGDQFLGGAARPEPGPGENLLEPFALVRCSPGRPDGVRVVIYGLGAGSSEMRRPRSSASTTSGAGTKSPSGGRSASESRPRRSRNSRVVPYSTALPRSGVATDLLDVAAPQERAERPTRRRRRGSRRSARARSAACRRRSPASRTRARTAARAGLRARTARRTAPGRGGSGTGSRRPRFTSTKPRPASRTRAASSRHSSSMLATGSSTSWARKLGSTGSVAAMTTASIDPARLVGTQCCRSAPRSGRRTRLLGLRGHRLGARPRVVPTVSSQSARLAASSAVSPSRRRRTLQIAERGELLDVDDALLVELEHGEEAHDRLELRSARPRRAGGSSPDRAPGSAAEHDSTASRTLARIGAMWSTSICSYRLRRQRPQRPPPAAWTAPPARAGRGRATGTAPRGRPRRARLRSARRTSVVQRRGRVLERLALEQAGEQEVALLEAQELLVELDLLERRQEAARLELDERRRDEQELGRDLEVEALHALELGEVLVDDRATARPPRGRPPA